MTPRQYRFLVDRHKERIEHEELLSGIIASTVANFSFGGVKKTLSPQDFMPSKWAAKKVRAKRPRTSKAERDATNRNIRCFLHAAFNAQKKLGA